MNLHTSPAYHDAQEGQRVHPRQNVNVAVEKEEKRGGDDEERQDDDVVGASERVHRQEHIRQTLVHGHASNETRYTDV